MTVAMVGCGLFETRDPDPPVGSSPTGDLALSAEEAIVQLETAIALHDPTLYMAAISDSFAVTVTPAAFPDDPAFFDGWDATREDAFIRSLLAPALLPADSMASLVFTPLQNITFADSAVIRESYQLTIAPNDPDLPTLYEGLAEIVIRRESDGGWRVLRWHDEAGGEAPAISQLRAAL